MIFANLQKSPRPFADIQIPENYLPVAPVNERNPEVLKERFVAESKKLGCVVYQTNDERDAVKVIINLLKNDTKVSAWDFDQISLPGLEDGLENSDIEIAAHDDPHVEFGITGASAALASTGSLILDSGSGKFRAPSILPPTHIVVLKESSIFATFESWVAHQRESGIENFSQPSNIVLVSGASRTADIAMELVMGMHGPKELHILLVP